MRYFDKLENKINTRRHEARSFDLLTSIPFSFLFFHVFLVPVDVVGVGNSGEIVDMRSLGIWDPYSVRVQTIQTAVEAATLLLRIDDVVSGLKKRDKLAPGQSPSGPRVDDGSQVDSESLLPE